MKIVNWLSKNSLTLILITVIGVLLLRGTVQKNMFSSPMVAEMGFTKATDSVSMTQSSGGRAVSMIAPMPASNIAPTNIKDRLVSINSNLAMQVNNVSESVKSIESEAKALDGFLVFSNVGQPEGPASGDITVRVPAVKKDEALETFKKHAIKVVSEYNSGNDVTDEYVDIESRLKTLEQTKTKFESMLTSATTVTETLEVQRELINIQSQIDSLIGQREYVKKSADYTRISISLSTDDLALPYTPNQPWRPAVILKQAVRSLVANLRTAGSVAIYIFVYSPLWLPVLFAIWYITKKTKSL